MAVGASDLKFYYSGGGSNADGTKSLGGAISSAVLPDHVLGNIMDRVSGTESKKGFTDYRGIYLKNTSTQSAFDVKIFFDEDSSNNKRDPAGNLLSPAVSDPISYNSQIKMGVLKTGSLPAMTSDISLGAGYSTMKFDARNGPPNLVDVVELQANAAVGIVIQRQIPSNTAAKDINHILVAVDADTGE